MDNPTFYVSLLLAYVLLSFILVGSLKSSYWWFYDLWQDYRSPPEDEHEYKRCVWDCCDLIQPCLGGGCPVCVPRG